MCKVVAQSESAAPPVPARKGAGGDLSDGAYYSTVSAESKTPLQILPGPISQAGIPQLGRYADCSLLPPVESLYCAFTSVSVALIMEKEIEKKEAFP